MENTDRHGSDYISKSIGSDWIDMNVFSINPNLVVVDRSQPSLIKLLEKHGEDRSWRGCVYTVEDPAHRARWEIEPAAFGMAQEPFDLVQGATIGS